jgi:hypothetical protein
MEDELGQLVEIVAAEVGAQAILSAGSQRAHSAHSGINATGSALIRAAV